MDYIGRRAQAKAVRERFFHEFAQCHMKWLRKLVAAYKERGIFPVLPTQIIDYYESPEDKEIAALSTFCMKWGNGKELEQIADMRRIMGEHPSVWFKSREFAMLSLGREQNKRLDGYTSGHYWKIARYFDMLYDACHDRRGYRPPSVVFSKSGFAELCQEASVVCKISDAYYKQSIIELVLRTSDGLGRNLWRTRPSNVRCPLTNEIKAYLRIWFKDWDMRLWTWDEAVHLFELKYDYDFFYAYYAHKELEKSNPIGCRKYATRFDSRWERQATYQPQRWDGGMNIMPDIVFLEHENTE